MRSTLGLILLTSAVSLTACSSRPLTLSDVDPCSWVRPIEFSDETKAWLEAIDWPTSAYADFNQIGDHNDKVREICLIEY
jgi:hypothetical protein